MRPPATAKVPVFKHVSEAPLSGNPHALSVHGHGDHIQAPRPDGLDGIHVCEGFAQDPLPLLNPIPVGIPDVGEQFDGFGKAVGITTAHDHFGPFRVGDIRV